MSNKPFPLVTRYGGEIKNLKRFVLPDSKRWSCFNPSIAQGANGYAMTFRSSNYIIIPDSGELHVVTGGPVKNQVWFTETNKDLELLDLRCITFDTKVTNLERGVEDAKLFWRDNTWMFTGIVMERDVPVARVGLFTLNAKTSRAKLIKLYDGQNALKPEKNWMAPYETNKNFDYIYGPTTIVKDDRIITTMTKDKRLAKLRGNTNLHDLGDGTYLALGHILYTKATRTWDSRIFSMRDGLSKNYTHRLLRFDNNGTLTQMSEEFQFISPGIEFAAGLVEMGDNYVITFGKDDVSSHVATIPKKNVLGLLVDV